MRILIDTCEFLWIVSGDNRLSPVGAEAVKSPLNEIYFSVVSFWEICIKYSLGKLPLPQSPDVYIPAQRVKHGIESLALDEASVMHLPLLPHYHKDPSDRMLVCQAKAHGMSLASSDPLT